MDQHTRGSAKKIVSAIAFFMVNIKLSPDYPTALGLSTKTLVVQGREIAPYRYSRAAA
ncbi:hypothetical protein [Luteolibacter sp.]|uniref:hypothetical protein n=1 Tax=Luteolibacter sp. TaxID=1962973 RepID=UPI003264C20F